MSNLIYPTNLVGEAWPVVKRPTFSTSKATAASGKQIRIANYPFPIWQWELPYTWLSSSAAISDLQTLMGFYAARSGSFDSFLFNDVSDNFITAQPIGTGDGVRTAFQLQRTLGSSTQPIFDINGVTANYPTGSPPERKMFLNGTQFFGSYNLGTTGLVTFASAPGAGVAITSEFGFFFRVHFLDDNLDFSEFANEYWETTKVALEQTTT
jgi:uncharacterized protein (TIGR02217 family)